jgi:hypothetical protein
LVKNLEAMLRRRLMPTLIVVRWGLMMRQLWSKRRGSFVMNSLLLKHVVLSMMCLWLMVGSVGTLLRRWVDSRRVVLLISTVVCMGRIV